MPYPNGPHFDTSCDPPQRFTEFTRKEAQEIIDAINDFSGVGPVMANLCEFAEKNGEFHIEIQMVGGSLVITNGSTGGTFRGYFNDTSGG